MAPVRQERAIILSSQAPRVEFSPGICSAVRCALPVVCNHGLDVALTTGRCVPGIHESCGELRNDATLLWFIWKLPIPNVRDQLHTGMQPWLHQTRFHLVLQLGILQIAQMQGPAKRGDFLSDRPRIQIPNTRYATRYR